LKKENEKLARAEEKGGDVSPTPLETRIVPGGGGAQTNSSAVLEGEHPIPSPPWAKKDGESNDGKGQGLVQRDTGRDGTGAEMLLKENEVRKSSGGDMTEAVE
jgi:hypothetical protein